MRRFPRLAALLTACVLLLGIGGWLAASERGLQTLLQLAGHLSGGQLHIAGQGRLGGPLHITQLRWQAGDESLELHDLRITWQPAALLAGRLQIDSLRIESLHLTPAAQSSSAILPADLQLPLTVDIAEWQISALQHGPLRLGDLSGRWHSDDQRHRLDDFSARLADIEIGGQLQLAATAPFAVDGRLTVRGRLADRPLGAQLTAGGALDRLRLEARADSGLSGSLQATLTPFAEHPFADARIALSDIDPSAWLAGAPAARLDLTADLVPDEHGLAGSFGISNRQPAPFDRGGLPLATLAGQLHWRAQQLDLPLLYATLAGDGGEVTGHGRWQADRFVLSATTRRLDSRRLHTALQSSRLSGPLQLTIDDRSQHLQLDQQAARFALQAELVRQNALIDLKTLALRAGDAALQMRGQWHEDDGRFNLDGELQGFDPARFARLPAARLNARLRAEGRFAGAPQLSGEFTLVDSLLAGQPLAGQGQLKLAWPRLEAADIKLSAGANQLHLHGAFGQPGDRLQLTVDARQLSPYGLQGGLRGQGEIGGSLQRPTLTADLSAPQLAWPGHFALRGLVLQARLAEAADAPLALHLELGQLEGADQETRLSQFRLHADGSRASHRLTLDTRLPADHHLQLSARGGEQDGRWRGVLATARLSEARSRKHIELADSAPLAIGADGWQIGPARLTGPPDLVQARFSAQADRQRLQASLQARGERMGTVDGQITANLLDPWTLAEQQPWRGQLQARLDQLGWLAELLGEGWQTAGRLEATLNLAGTPARMLLSGRLHGDALELRQPDQGLTLNAGELRAEISDNRLDIRRFSFANPHQPLPRPLQQQLTADDAARLAAPGRVDISGQLDVAPNAGAGTAALMLTLDRLGAWQQADQWLTVSGSSQIRWQPEGLGLRGQLAIDAAYWQLAPAGMPRLSDDVVIRRAGEAPAARPRPRLELDLEADFGRHFLFSGAGLESRLAGRVRLNASGRDLPRASGSIRVRDGRYAAYGQQLEIERGILNFQGLPENPALDIRAVRKGLPVEAGVQIGGTAQRPVVRLVSEPEVPDTEKLAWLVLGHGGDSVGPGDAATLLSAAGGLLGNAGGGVIQQLKQTFGIDELGVRQGKLDGSGGRQPGSRIAGGSTDTAASTGNQIFSIGKRLSRNALLSYEQTVGKAESVVKLSISLTRELSLVGRAGSDNALDLFYTLTWGRPADPARPAAPPP